MEEQADKECGSSIEIVMFAYIPVFSCKKNTGKVGARNQNATLLPPGVNGLGLSDGKSSFNMFWLQFFFFKKIKSIYFFFFGRKDILYGSMERELPGKHIVNKLAGSFQKIFRGNSLLDL